MTEAYSTIQNVQRYYGRVENGKIVEYGMQLRASVNFVQLAHAIFSFREI